jgi:copper chaperone
MAEFVYRVTGMTCEHCEHRVAGEAGSIPGVELAVADAATGMLVVTAASDPGQDAIRGAVDEAGYELASA